MHRSLVIISLGAGVGMLQELPETIPALSTIIQSGKKFRACQCGVCRAMYSLRESAGENIKIPVELFLK